MKAPLRTSSSQAWKRQQARNGCLIAVAFVLIVGGCFGGCVAVTRATEKTVTFTVRRVDDQATRGGHKYLVFTDHGVYEDKDSFMYLKWNSSDLYNNLQVGHKYTCKTVGMRLPFASSYRNLIKCHDAK